MRKFALLLLVLAGLFAFALPSAAQNLVQNSGFETPTVATYVVVGTSNNPGIESWNVGANIVFHMSNGQTGGNTAYEGSQFVQLNADACWISQQLATVPGQTYKVTFQMMGNTDAGYGLNADNTAQVIWIKGGTTENLINKFYTYHQNNSPSNPMWEEHSFVVTAATDRDIIAFGGGPNRFYPRIDAVSVVPYTAVGTVTGRVYDAATNVGVPHAEVMSGSGTIVEADANGVYTMTLPGNATVDLTASQDDYYDGVATGVVATADVTTTVDIAATHLPATTAVDTVTDSFTRFAGIDLGATEGVSSVPWLKSGSEILASLSNDSFVLGSATSGPGYQSPGFGVSLGGGFLPADFDMAVDVSVTSPGGWGGIAYRQPLVGLFDSFGGMSDSGQWGYLLSLAADGSAINIWRTAALASAPFSTPIDWSTPHRVRVRVIRNHHQIFLDGVRIINKILNDKLAGGYFSLERDASETHFDNLTITRYTTNDGQISGTVTDFATSATVPNAKVWLNTGNAAQSDGIGGYAITRLAGGTYNLTVTADGYYPRTVMGIVLADATTSITQNVELLPLPAQSSVVTDDFNRPDNYDSLGTTLAPQFLPWIAEPYKCWIAGNKLAMSFEANIGVSLGGGFAPADIDMSASLATGGSGGWVGLAYRQQLAGTYDGLRDQAANQAGYVAYLTDDGKQVVLWRNGLIAAGNVSLTPQQEHLLRVRAIGSHHEVWVDGQKCIDAWESSKLAGGFVGIISEMEWSTADNLSVGSYVDPAYRATMWTRRRRESDLRCSSRAKCLPRSGLARACISRSRMALRAYELPCRLPTASSTRGSASASTSEELSVPMPRRASSTFRRA